MIFAQFMTISVFLMNMVFMMGLAVGIDYCLFIIARYREERARGLEKLEMSWILEHNHGVRNIIESVGGEVTKRYRMYEKEL